MPLSDFALNAMADHLASIATQVSLHSADPGATGANETTAARQVPAFTAAANGGDISLSAAENFTGGAASGPCTHCGLWDATGNWLGGFALTGDQTFNAAGEYTLNNLSLTGSSS